MSVLPDNKCFEIPDIYLRGSYNSLGGEEWEKFLVDEELQFLMEMNRTCKCGKNHGMILVLHHDKDPNGSDKLKNARKQGWLMLAEFTSEPSSLVRREG